MSSPKYPLKELKKLVTKWMRGEDSGYFSAPSASTDYVIHVMSCTEQEAATLIWEGLLKLDESDFSSRLLMWSNTVVADLYGLEGYLGHNWYVKFLIEENVIEAISFHPLEGDLRLADGRTLEVTLEESSRLPRNKRRK